MVTVSFGILNSNPLVAALWGILFWREFDGVSARVKLLFGGLLTGFVVSIVLIVLSGYVEPTHPLLSTCSEK